MALAAEGYISKPNTLLATLLANSARFRTIVGASTVAEAEQRIHLPLAMDRLDEYDLREHPLPRAIISRTGGMLTGGSYSSGGPGGRKSSGVLILAYEFSIPSLYVGNPRDEHTWFTNQIGVIHDEMFAKRNEGGFLHVDSFEDLDEAAPLDDEVFEGETQIPLAYGASFLVHFSGV